MKYDLDRDLPQIHPRHEPVEYARRELAQAVADIAKKHSLTPSETFALLAGEVSGLASCCIRSERSERRQK